MKVDRAVETVLANLLIEISKSIKADPEFRPDINYDVQNPASVVLLVKDGIRELKKLGPMAAIRLQHSEHVATLKPGSARKPKVSFQIQTEILCRSAEQRIISYMPDNGVHFIDDAELEPIRRVFPLVGGQR